MLLLCSSVITNDMMLKEVKTLWIKARESVSITALQFYKKRDAFCNNKFRALWIKYAGMANRFIFLNVLTSADLFIAIKYQIYSSSYGKWRLGKRTWQSVNREVNKTFLYQICTHYQGKCIFLNDWSINWMDVDYFVTDKRERLTCINLSSFIHILPFFNI